MSIDLNTLAGELRSQLTNLAGGSSTPGDSSAASADVYLEVVDTFEDPDAENRVRRIALQLSPEAAQALSSALSSTQSGTDSNAGTEEDQQWNATTERVSEIEGFTGGDSA